MLNRVDLMGRLCSDPDFRMASGDVPVATFPIACERDYKNQAGERETDFISIVAWRGTAEFISRNFQKGQMIAVTGRLQNRTWTDKEGNKKTVSEVIADNVYFAGSRPKQEEYDDEDELPFN